MIFIVLYGSIYDRIVIWLTITLALRDSFERVSVVFVRLLKVVILFVYNDASKIIKVKKIKFWMIKFFQVFFLLVSDDFQDTVSLCVRLPSSDCIRWFDFMSFGTDVECCRCWVLVSIKLLQVDLREKPSKRRKLACHWKKILTSHFVSFDQDKRHSDSH